VHAEIFFKNFVVFVQIIFFFGKTKISYFENVNEYLNYETA